MKVGPLLILGKDEDLGRPRSYQELRELALTSERGGLDTVWVYDHLFYHFPDQEPAGVWEGWTIWSALAEATERIELGALVLCTAFRNPAVTAKMAVTLDEVSNGRVILGLGAGWHKPEFDAFGLDFTHKVDQFEEAIKIICPLVREGEVDFQGQYHQANNCQILPRPTRNIPVLIAGRQPRMLSLIAKYADQFNMAWHGNVESIAEKRAAMETACEAEGRDPATLEMTVGVNVGFPELGELPEGYDDPAKAIAGSIDDVAAGIRAYADAGIGQIQTMTHPHNVDGFSALCEAVAKSRG